MLYYFILKFLQITTALLVLAIKNTYCSSTISASKFVLITGLRDEAVLNWKQVSFIYIKQATVWLILT